MNNWQLTIIIGLVLMLVVLCVIYLISNRGNDKVIELSFKSLLVPVVIAFGLFLFELFKPVDVKKDKMVFSITEDPFNLNKLITHHDGSFGQANIGTMEVTVFYGKNKTQLPLDSKKNRIEIAELLLLHLIHKRYSMHWQIDYDQNEAFFESMSSVTSQKEFADKDKYVLTESVLHEIYPKDHLIQHIDSEIQFVLPINTTCKVHGDENFRKINFTNKYLSCDISIKSVGVGTLPHSGGKTASQIRNKLNLPLDESYRLDFYGYVLKMTITPNRFLKWNPKTIEQTQWLTELFDYLRNSYGWEAILQQLKDNKNS